MERGSKRKAANAMSPDAEGKGTKRQRLVQESNQASTVETPETTREAGLRFLDSLKQARDKHGRLISTDFVDLPDKNQHPDYYVQIRLPISINSIEQKLNRMEYPNLTAIESDVKRMVNNAKQYNDRRSALFEDAERIRKMLSNWMVKFNPAYQDPNYVAVATPVPGEEGRRNGSVATPTPALAIEPRRQASMPKPSQSMPSPSPARQSESIRRGSSSQTPAAPDGGHDATGEVHKKFRDAQDRIIADLIKYKDESELEIFTPFVNLPSRTLTDYYALIKYPVSLKSVQKKVRGIHGRSPPTGITDFKSWDAFEEEVSYIWRNAQEYNEDGSDIFLLANDFEEMFKAKLAEAKLTVQEPPQPTLRLKMGSSKPPIKLRLGQHKESPAPAVTPPTRASLTPGIAVDNQALQRQQLHVQAGVKGQNLSNGQAPERVPLAPSTTAASNTPGPLSRKPSSEARDSPAYAPIAVKNETKTGPSPSPALAPTPHAVNGLAPSISRQSSNTAMPPPVRPLSGSPHPSQPQLAVAPPVHQQYYPSANYFDDRKFRAAGKTAADALLPEVLIMNPPNASRQLRVPIKPHPTMATQSLTLNLPASNSTLHIRTTLANGVQARPHKLFVTAGGQRLSAMPQLTGQADLRKPTFEAKLMPGVNRIEIELAAATSARGASKTPGTPQTGGEVEIEKITIFANVLRS